MHPFRAQDSLKSQGKGIFKSWILTQLRAANRETSRLIPKQTSTSISLSLSPILLIDSREENTQACTQRHISPPSSGYGTPTDMKKLRLLLRRTLEAWHRMKGNPSYRNNTGNCKNARWPFRADWMGFSPWPSPRHTHTSTHTNLPPPSVLLFCLLVTSVSVQSLQCEVDPFTFVSQFIPSPLHPPCFFFSSSSYCCFFFFSFTSISFFTRAVEQSICRKALRYHVSLWNMWYRLWSVHVYSIFLLYCLPFVCSLHLTKIYYAFKLKLSLTDYLKQKTI